MESVPEEPRVQPRALISISDFGGPRLLALPRAVASSLTSPYMTAGGHTGRWDRGQFLHSIPALSLERGRDAEKQRQRQSDEDTGSEKQREGEGEEGGRRRWRRERSQKRERESIREGQTQSD